MGALLLPSKFFIMKVISINEFIEYAKKNPLKFVNYCELIITSYGGIILNEGSHVETIISYIIDTKNITRDEISDEIPNWCLPIEWLVDKYKLIAVWYSGYLHTSYKINRFQKRTINMLMDNNLIASKEELYIQEASAYNYKTKRSTLE